jgi:hypothetical protein
MLSIALAVGLRSWQGRRSSCTAWCICGRKVMAKSNKYLLDLEDKFTRKHNEIDRLALVIAADDAGVEDVDGLLDRFLKTRQQIASDLFTDSKADRSLTYTKHDIATRIKSVIDWQRWQILFPLLKDYWER